MTKPFTTLLLAATLVSCINPTGTVTNVTVGANPSSISTNATSILSTVVTGTGGFSQAVTWSIVSGAGSLGPSTGAGMTFNASNSAGSTVVKATSTQDSSKSGTVTVTITSPSTGSVIR